MADWYVVCPECEYVLEQVDIVTADDGSVSCIACGYDVVLDPDAEEGT
jgi:hypothetical protein